MQNLAEANVDVVIVVVVIATGVRCCRCFCLSYCGGGGGHGGGHGGADGGNGFHEQAGEDERVGAPFVARLRDSGVRRPAPASLGVGLLVVEGEPILKESPWPGKGPEGRGGLERTGKVQRSGGKLVDSSSTRAGEPPEDLDRLVPW